MNIYPRYSGPTTWGQTGKYSLKQLMFKIKVGYDFALVSYAWLYEWYSSIEHCTVLMSGHQKFKNAISQFCQTWTVSAEILWKLLKSEVSNYGRVLSEYKLISECVEKSFLRMRQSRKLFETAYLLHRVSLCFYLLLYILLCFFNLFCYLLVFITLLYDLLSKLFFWFSSCWAWLGFWKVET